MTEEIAVPQVSIVTVNTNEKHRMLLYMPSVWKAVGDFEVIISDNGSTDGSVEFIEAEYPRTRLVKNGGNLGFAAANNRAAVHARGPILVFLNPDTTVEPDWLIELLKPFADPKVGLTTSKLTLMSDPSKLNTCGNEVHISGLTMCRGMGQPRTAFARDEEVSAVSGAAFAIRREIFEAIGGFNEGFFIYMEETAMSLEARLRGWRIVYTSASVVHHDYVLKFGPRKVLYQERNRAMLLLQTYRWRTLIALMPALLLAEVVTWGFVLTRDRANWTNKLRAYGQLFGRWSDIIARRRLNQAGRTVRDRDLLLTTTHAVDFGQVEGGWVGRAARAIFNPFFWLSRQFALLIVWW